MGHNGDSDVTQINHQWTNTQRNVKYSKAGRGRWMDLLSRLGSNFLQDKVRLMQAFVVMHVKID